MAEAFGIACHELVSLDFRCGSTCDIPSLVQNVACWGISGPRSERPELRFLAKRRHSNQTIIRHFGVALTTAARRKGSTVSASTGPVNLGNPGDPLDTRHDRANNTGCAGYF